MTRAAARHRRHAATSGGSSSSGRRAAGWDVAGVGVGATSTSATRPRRRCARRMADADVIVHTAYARDGPTRDRRDGRRHGERRHAAVAPGARLVHVSTDVVFDGRPAGPTARTTRCRRHATTGGPRRPPRQLVRTIAPGALIVRTSLIYGGRTARRRRTSCRPRSDRDVLRRRAALPGPGRRPRRRARRARRGSTSPGIAPRRRAGRRVRAPVRELIAGRPVRHAPAPPGRPLDCRLDTSHAAAIAGNGPAWRQRGLRPLSVVRAVRRPGPRA